MADILDDKIKEFLSLFDGDISAAQAALNAYAQRQRNISTPTQAPAGEEVVSLRGVSKQYKLGKQSVEALRDITISINKGSYRQFRGAFLPSVRP